jgi:hypothetical protein
MNLSLEETLGYPTFTEAQFFSECPSESSQDPEPKIVGWDDPEYLSIGINTVV